MLHRSSWKIPYVDVKNKVNFYDDICLDMDRNITITYGLLNSDIRIYTGRRYVCVSIGTKYLGLKFGELAFAKTPAFVRKDFGKKKKFRQKRKVLNKK